MSSTTQDCSGDQQLQAIYIEKVQFWSRNSKRLPFWPLCKFVGLTGIALPPGTFGTPVSFVHVPLVHLSDMASQAGASRGRAGLFFALFAFSIVIVQGRTANLPMVRSAGW